MVKKTRQYKEANDNNASRQATKENYRIHNHNNKPTSTNNKANNDMKKKANRKLVPSKVYVRIRPMVFDGSGHDQNGAGVAKSLAAYSESSVTLQTQYMFSKGSNEYTFPQKVFAPESTQTDVYETALPALVEHVADNNNDAMLLCYGQTGTGKTVTIFGFEASLQAQIQPPPKQLMEQGSCHPDWGILPRLTQDLFSKFSSKATRRVFVIAISAIEFYLDNIFDLLLDDSYNNDDNYKGTVRMDAQNKPAGYKRIILHEPRDIFDIIETIMARRATRGTHMNLNSSSKDKDEKGGGHHAGSSRSHCSVIFTILQVQNDNDDAEDNAENQINENAANQNNLHQPSPKSTQKKALFKQTQFHLVDLAGAERPSKVGDGSDDVQGSGMMAEYKLWRGEPISALEEGMLINYTLFELCREVKLATELHKQRKPYRAPRQNCTNLIPYLGRCMDGRALLAMIVCLSQAPQCGWETWFSLNYGTDLSKLCTPVTATTQAKWFELTKALPQCQATLEKAEKALVDHEKQHAGSHLPNAKRWHGLKRTDVREAKEKLWLLEELRARLNRP